MFFLSVFSKSKKQEEREIKNINKTEMNVTQMKNKRPSLRMSEQNDCHRNPIIG